MSLLLSVFFMFCNFFSCDVIVATNANANIMGPGNVPLLVACAVNYPFQTFNRFNYFFHFFKMLSSILCTINLFIVSISCTCLYCFLSVSEHKNIKQIWSCKLLPPLKIFHFPSIFSLKNSMLLPV